LSRTVRGTQRALSAVNRELELLSKAFSLAIDQGLAIHNPCQKVKRFREDNERNRYLSDEEEPRLLSVLSFSRPATYSRYQAGRCGSRHAKDHGDIGPSMYANIGALYTRD
jgi:hypothetical protein